MEDHLETAQEVERFSRALDAWLGIDPSPGEAESFAESFPDALRVDFSAESQIRRALRSRLEAAAGGAGLGRKAQTPIHPMPVSRKQTGLVRITPAWAWASAALAALLLLGSALFASYPPPVTSPAPSLTMTLLPSPSVSTVPTLEAGFLSYGQTPTPAAVWISVPSAAPAPHIYMKGR